MRFALQNAFGGNRCFSAEACGAAIWRLPLSAETAKRVKCHAFALYGFGFFRRIKEPQKNRFALRCGLAPSGANAFRLPAAIFCPCASFERRCAVCAAMIGVEPVLRRVCGMYLYQLIKSCFLRWAGLQNRLRCVIIAVRFCKTEPEAVPASTDIRPPHRIDGVAKIPLPASIFVATSRKTAGTFPEIPSCSGGKRQ